MYPPIHSAKEYFLCTSAGISSSHMEGPEFLQSQAERRSSNLLNAGQKEHVASLRELLGFPFILETEEHPDSSVLGLLAWLAQQAPLSVALPVNFLWPLDDSKIEI